MSLATVLHTVGVSVLVALGMTPLTSPALVAGLMADGMNGRMKMTQKKNALDMQVGGGHYKDFVIQPFEYNQRNRLPFGEACIVKYVSRHRQKGGLEDLRKAKHFLELIAELEYGVML